MARETFNPIMSHYQIEVDIQTLIGEKNISPSGPSTFATFLSRIRSSLVLFTGEMPRSSFESGYDFTKPSESMAVNEGSGSEVSKSWLQNFRLQRFHQ